MGRRAREASGDDDAPDEDAIDPMITTRPNLFDAGPVLVPDETDDLFSTDPLPTLPLQTPLFAVDDDGSDDARASG